MSENGRWIVRVSNRATDVARRRPKRQPLLVTSGLVILVVSVLLSACASDTHTAATQRKAQLDRELHTATVDYNAPPSLIAPIVAEEQQVAAHLGSSDASATHAVNTYTQLYQRVVAIEQTTPEQARTLTQSDLATLTAAVQNVQTQGLIEAAPYQQNLHQTLQQVSDATTTKRYFALDTYVQAQLAAVNAILPTYQRMTALDTLVQTQNSIGASAPAQAAPLQCAQGQNNDYWYSDPAVTVQPAAAQQASSSLPPIGTQWHDQNLADFRAARSAEDYAALQRVIEAQTSQLTAESATRLPYTVNQLVQKFAADVQAYQQDGGTDTSYQQQVTQDQQIAAANSPTTALTLVQTLQQQEAALQTPLLKVKTQHDFDTLKQLVAQGQAKTTLDPANGIAYPDAYEYADANTGIGDALDRLKRAQSADDFDAVDREILMFTTNIQAMLQNLSDATPANQPHQTDTTLLQHYGVQGTKVIVVSLREQVARFYDSGKLVKADNVTTGAPDLPSIAGIHCVLYKEQNTVFRSPDPPGSPHYYQPTPIHYALLYSYSGYEMHDAWWRNEFGLYTNLPHYDPAAFNGGSHGCVNFALSDSGWVYSWADIGTPMIVY